MGLFFNSLNQYSSSLYEIARNLLRSRNTQRARADKLAVQNQQLKTDIERHRCESQEAKKQHEQTKARLRQQEEANEELRRQPVTLPSDLALADHTYGVKMMALCMNLCKEIGFRPAETALTIVFNWFGIEAKVPSHSSMRLWSCRAGVAQLKQLRQQGDDWIWIADHSNQIGQEKVLLIIGVRTADLPPTGETLPLDKMVVLAAVPGTKWTCADVRREYAKLAEQIGPPKYLLTDGAVELRDSADVLENNGKKPILLRDMKHFAANVFEKLVGKDEKFQAFLSKLGRTRSSVQQTELGHFTPPPQKPKARFMNLGATLRWGQMVSYHLSHPHSKSRHGITPARVNEKLGWVREFRDELAAWSRCQKVVQTSLRFINRQGVYHGAAAKLAAELDRMREKHPHDCELSNTMATKLIAFVQESETQLEQGERTWLSTENIESLFGRYKRLEGQHSKGGFTSLIAALPALLVDWTAARVRDALSDVSVKEMKLWVTENLGTTLTAKKNTAYRELAKSRSG